MRDILKSELQANPCYFEGTGQTFLSDLLLNISYLTIVEGKALNLLSKSDGHAKRHDTSR